MNVVQDRQALRQMAHTLTSQLGLRLRRALRFYVGNNSALKSNFIDPNRNCSIALAPDANPLSWEKLRAYSDQFNTKLRAYIAGAELERRLRGNERKPSESIEIFVEKNGDEPF